MNDRRSLKPECILDEGCWKGGCAQGAFILERGSLKTGPACPPPQTPPRAADLSSGVCPADVCGNVETALNHEATNDARDDALLEPARFSLPFVPAGPRMCRPV